MIVPLKLLVFMVEFFILKVTAQINLALEGQVKQSSTYETFGPELAIEGPANNDWNDGCSSTNTWQKTAWWRSRLPELVYVTNIELYYRNRADRMKDFRLILSNRSVYDRDVFRCYTDLGIAGYPDVTQNIDCNTLTKNIYFFNRRSSTPGGEGAFVELCYIAIYGCWKGTWGINCTNSCPANCIDHHCYPGNGSCIWGCDSRNCLHDKCDTNTGVCSDGCKAGHVGQNCNNEFYNIASNGTATENPQSISHPAYLSIDGKRTGSCSMLSGPNSYLQIDMGFTSIITMIYLTLNDTGSAPLTVDTHSVYCTNTSDDWKESIVLYHGERPTKDIHVSAVCRYVIYVPHSISGISEVDLCEIEIGGCPFGKYGVNCEMNCSENCILGSCNLVNGNCTHGCVDGWFGERCNEPCYTGFYGNQCMHTCSQHCFLPPCHHVTGQCSGGCTHGWTAEDCFKECSPGYFGRNCSESCDGCLSNTCDRFDGFCNVKDKCKAGYINYPKCNQSCAYWFYGENCSNKCNCLSEPCNKSTGMCHGGKCDRGWSGESCNKECSEGYFGYNCIGYCNNCLNTSCEIYGGNCTHGSKQTEFQSIEEPGPVTLIIGGICAAIFMVFLAIILFIVYRRFSRSQKHRNHHSMEEDKKTRSALTDQSAMYENVTGDFASSENIQLSFEEKHDRKIRTCGISSNDLPDEEEEGNVNVYGNVMSEDDMCQHKIQIENLSNVIHEKRKDNGFEKEYRMFPKGLIHTHVEGSKEENKAKNRFLTTWPYDHSRVVLKGDTKYDYINANYIDSYYKEKAYIATQGPKRNTVRDFWHMIWQENVVKIVMVTQLEEEGKKKCDQYWPQTINKPLIVGNFVLTMEVEKEHSVYLYRKINVKHKLEKQERRVHHFHFIQWPDHGVPDSIKLVDFYRAVTNISCDQPGPLLVHCSAGIGRTGTFIAINSLYEHGKSVGYIDVKEYVQIMRKNRMNMIQTFEQYEAVFETLQELFTVPNTSIQVNDFCSYVQEQENTKVPQNQKTYRLEFQRLQSLRPSYSSEHFTSSILDDNMSKNAVNSILPHDDFRPYLMSFGKHKSNYINAVIIPGYSVHGNFLVTQCPLKETVVDFWTMVYDHDSSIVVLLDTLNEDAPLWSNTDKTLEFEKFDIELDNDKTPREVQLAIVHRANKPDKRSIHVFLAKEYERGNSSLSSTADMMTLMQRVIDQRKHHTFVVYLTFTVIYYMYVKDDGSCCIYIISHWSGENNVHHGRNRLTTFTII
ncbi:uncharacterized protein LOC134726180 [Mytilus trossulus]|uniref:uncharacterized protein LOC134726180 n=1 Tax=Mytilus trossulus TaxID=6551 RepID=UPI0030074D92